MRIGVELVILFCDTSALMKAGLRPIQMSNPKVLGILAKGRTAFTTDERRDFLIRSIGIEPTALDERAKMVVQLRMAPFVERNFNLVELGPRGTGMSHLFQQISPYSHLISSGKATVAKMFAPSPRPNTNGSITLSWRRCVDRGGGL